MNRRQVLKNLGLGAGALIVGPSTLSLLQSCSSEPKDGWKPVFLSVSNGYALAQILDVIIPTTDTPGAKELNIASFIDSYMDEVVSEEAQKNFKESANSFASAFKNEFDKDTADGTPEDYEKIVARYLKRTPSGQENVPVRTTETQDPIDQNPELEMDYDPGALAYLQEVRGMAIWAYKTSEEIGENVMWYDPVPGQYIPIGSVEDLGQGKAMSL